MNDAIETYKKFDEDQSDSLDTDELAKLLSIMGFELDDDSMQKILEEIDEDQSGEVSLEEFVQWYLKIDS